VADEDHRRALGRHRADGREQRLDLEGREHRGGLVEQEHGGAAVEQLDDLDPLALPDGQVADAGPGIDRAAVPLADLGDALLDPPAGQADRLVEVAEGDVLGHGEPLDEAEVLVDHPDAARQAVPRARRPDRLPAMRTSPSSGA
jgi:hypothetical protein